MVPHDKSQPASIPEQLFVREQTRRHFFGTAGLGIGSLGLAQLLSDGQLASAAVAKPGTPGVPQTAWPPLSRTGATAPGPNVTYMEHPDPIVGPGDEGHQTDHDLMGVALAEAALAAAAGEVPVGAVVAVGGRIVARRHNEREATGDPTAHAEVLALRDRYRFRPGHVFLMAEGTDSETLREREKWLAPLCVRHGFRLSDRLHIHLFGDTRAT